MNFQKIYIAYLLIILTVSACRKYPDGPSLSLRSKTERAINHWKVAQALDNGKEVTSDYNQYELDIKKGGTASLAAKYSFLGSDYEYITNGSWTFVNEKEDLSFDFENNDADGVYLILKLKEDEMWLKKNGGTVELHFVPNN